MAVMNHATVVGVFDDQAAARRAVAELIQAGFRENEIGVITREEKTVVTGTTPVEKSKWEEGAATGVVAGAATGALWALGIAAHVLPGIGPVVGGGILGSLLASAAGTAAAAGLLGALIGLGIPEEEARYYEEQFKAGRTLVTVKAAGRYEEAVDILRRHGAHDMANRAATV